LCPDSPSLTPSLITHPTTQVAASRETVTADQGVPRFAGESKTYDDVNDSAKTKLSYKARSDNPNHIKFVDEDEAMENVEERAVTPETEADFDTTIYQPTTLHPNIVSKVRKDRDKARIHR
jgi:hypothetical protein